VNCQKVKSVKLNKELSRGKDRKDAASST